MPTESRPPLSATRDTILRTLTWLALGGVSFAGAYFITQFARPKAGGPVGPAVPGMVWIPGGEFTMGTDSADAWSDEKPAHQVAVDGFWMDEHEVTNAQFREFVDATGYVTTAEKAPDLDEIMSQVAPGTPPPDPQDLVPGSLVFTPPEHSVKLDDFTQWWRWTPGTNWRRPEGPDSSIEGRDDHPVVQVSWDDARAYAEWAGKRLPTEAEWERAARGGLERQPYVWGNEPPAEQSSAEQPFRANLWQGTFPNQNTATDGFERTAPVKSFAPNGYGLYDMAGNVWEWCSDWYQRDLYASRPRDRVTRNPKGPGASSDAARPFTPQRSQKGGSFLCNDSYCSRYRPSARHGSSPDTGMSHVGFRCAKSAATATKP
ncbi:MAG: formylglycine-generating enzyme family protein [Planctomycetaceae bacterium]|nr:MAG: formylglycine-generating enzyme family protein [Planctomycetaceae bacterium]